MTAPADQGATELDKLRKRLRAGVALDDTGKLRMQTGNYWYPGSRNEVRLLLDAYDAQRQELAALRAPVTSEEVQQMIVKVRTKGERYGDEAAVMLASLARELAKAKAIARTDRATMVAWQAHIATQDTKLAAANARAEAWHRYAAHLEWCTTCAQDGIPSCPDGRELRDATPLAPQPQQTEGGA
jgi:hypothetical protein